ncbi:MAG: TonB family protein [Chitinispirillales bacterium]|jgi:TonB family protein|nr:TonB family protein [Chitinispirillales bacterium]
MEANDNTNKDDAMRKTFLLALCLTLFSIGCTPKIEQTSSGGAPKAVQKAILSKGLPDDFFTDSQIYIDKQKNVSYAFESKLDDPFPYYDAFVDLNPSYESVLEHYMGSKYTVAGKSGGDCRVGIVLEKCSYQAVGAPGAYNMKAVTEITVMARIDDGGKVSERRMAATGEFTGNYSDAGTVTNSFDLAIRGSISRIDKFLNSALNITAEASSDGNMLGGLKRPIPVATAIDSGASPAGYDVMIKGIGGLPQPVRSGAGLPRGGLLGEVRPQPVGVRDRAGIQKVVTENMPSLRRAYKNRLRGKPDLSGKIAVKFAINGYGAVVSAEVVKSSSTIDDPEFEGNVVEIVLKWDFGRIDEPKDITVVTIPFAFKE